MDAGSRRLPHIGLFFATDSLVGAVFSSHTRVFDVIKTARALRLTDRVFFLPVEADVAAEQSYL